MYSLTAASSFVDARVRGVAAMDQCSAACTQHHVITCVGGAGTALLLNISWAQHADRAADARLVLLY